MNFNLDNSKNDVEFCLWVRFRTHCCALLIHSFVRFSIRLFVIVIAQWSGLQAQQFSDTKLHWPDKQRLIKKIYKSQLALINCRILLYFIQEVTYMLLFFSLHILAKFMMKYTCFVYQTSEITANYLRREFWVQLNSTNLFKFYHLTVLHLWASQSF